MRAKQGILIKTLPFIFISLILLGVFIIPQISSGTKINGEENYACWNDYSNPITISSFDAINKTFGNSTISFQQNFILESRSNSSMLWYQYDYFPFNKYFALEMWENGELISIKTLNMGNINFVPKEIYLYNFPINNNTVEVVFNTTFPNKTFETYLNIPRGYYVSSRKVSSNSLFRKNGYYNTENFELDFNQMPNNAVFLDIFALKYYITAQNQIFGFQTCNKFN